MEVFVVRNSTVEHAGFNRNVWGSNAYIAVYEFNNLSEFEARRPPWLK